MRTFVKDFIKIRVFRAVLTFHMKLRNLKYSKSMFMSMEDGSQVGVLWLGRLYSLPISGYKVRRIV